MGEKDGREGELRRMGERVRRIRRMSEDDEC
jgi:hypothetical protein